MVLLEACSSMVLVSDGFLVSVILSSVISPTGGMVMCFSSSQVSILHLQKDLLIVFSCDRFFDRILSCFLSYILLMFSTCFLVIRVFSQKDICHWATASIVVAGGFAVLLFWGAYIAPFWWVLSFFLSKFCSRSWSSTVCDSHADSVYYISYISSTISGLDHCTWSPQDKSQSQFFHTSLKRKEPKHKQKAGSLFYTEHNQQQTSQPKQSTISTYHYLQLQKILPDRFLVTHSVQN